MSTVVFTSWQDLYSAALNNLTEFVLTGKFQSVSYSYGGFSMTYRTPDDLKKSIEWLRTMADIEQGRAVGRTYARAVDK